MNKYSGIVPFSEDNKVKLVRYGAVAMETYGNKKIPILGIDTSARPDLREMILIHKNLPPGDCITQWTANVLNKKLLILSFKFLRPTRMNFYIPLYFHEHSWVIEGILKAKAVFLKSATRSETTEEMLNGLDDSISIEIGASTEIPANWRKWQEKSVKKHLKSSGLSRKETAKKAAELIQSTIEFWEEHVDFEEPGNTV